jgi:hypothetical protein
MKTLKKLYRPVGLIELDLILDANLKKFPPRLDWQPIFYPVLNVAYAIEIAQKWNLTDKASGYSGFVTSFDIPQSYADTFAVQNVGGTIHNELWVLAEQLDEFNANIQGCIQIEAAFYGEKYEGILTNSIFFKNQNARQQILTLSRLDFEQLQKIIVSEYKTVFANFAFWQKQAQNAALLQQISQIWRQEFPNWNLWQD